MSTILAIEAASDACSVALLVGESVHEIFEITPRGHAQRLLPMIDEIMKQHDLALSALDAIAFGCGPGSFTGLRIAAGVTQGLAFGANLPVLAVSTLQTLAVGALRNQQDDPAQSPLLQSSPIHCLSVLDARMGEVYCGLYRTEEGFPELCGKELVCKPEALTAAMLNLQPDDKVMLVGNGALLLSEQLESMRVSVTCIDETCMPRARDVAVLGQQLFSAGIVLSAEQAAPVYLRGASAWKKRDQQH
jgi:tRNA threonylcarbamoyladenosine biosynthesis protein TsaB